jgi:glycosyltransferase involved in cell wall biosynthesis
MGNKYKFDYSVGSVYEKVLGLIRNSVLPGKDILEFGAGNAPMQEILRNCGYGYIGSDVDVPRECGLGIDDTSLYHEDLNGDLARSFELADLGYFSNVGCVILVNVLEHVTNPKSVLDKLNALSARIGSPPLVVAVPNVAHHDVTRKLATGRWDPTAEGILDSSHQFHFTYEKLVSVTASSSWFEIGQDDQVQYVTDQRFPSDFAVSEHSDVGTVVDFVRGLGDGFSSTYEFVRLYARGDQSEDLFNDSSTKDRPFLSVLMRTQGKRLQMLWDVLTSLAAQSSSRFEVLLSCHNVSDELFANIAFVVDAFEPDFREHITILRVIGGGRCRPLNQALAVASGQYFIILDDDDMVLGNWVERFEQIASENPGKVLRVVAAQQTITPQKWKSNYNGFLPSSGPMVVYPLVFDFKEHLYENQSPPMSYAIPLAAYRDLSIQYDDDLPVLEDWDVLMRSANLLGVVSSPEILSIYRMWKGGENSLSLHSKREWDNSKASVLLKLDRVPGFGSNFTLGSFREMIVDKREMELRIRDLEISIAQLHLERESFSHQLRDLIASDSWLITKPFRVMSGLIRRVLGKYLRSF